MTSLDPAKKKRKLIRLSPGFDFSFACNSRSDQPLFLTSLVIASHHPCRASKPLCSCRRCHTLASSPNLISSFYLPLPRNTPNHLCRPLQRKLHIQLPSTTHHYHNGNPPLYVQCPPFSAIRHPLTALPSLNINKLTIIFRPPSRQALSDRPRHRLHPSVVRGRPRSSLWRYLPTRPRI